jgi:hypothetical protein
MNRMKTTVVSPGAVISLAVVFLFSSVTGKAQETSRQIPFANLTTTLPQRSTQSITVQLQDAAGVVLFAESQTQVLGKARPGPKSRIWPRC